MWHYGKKKLEKKWECMEGLSFSNHTRKEPGPTRKILLPWKESTLTDQQQEIFLILRTEVSIISNFDLQRFLSIPHSMEKSLGDLIWTLEEITCLDLFKRTVLPLNKKFQSKKGPFFKKREGSWFGWKRVRWTKQAQTKKPFSLKIFCSPKLFWLHCLDFRSDF